MLRPKRNNSYQPLGLLVAPEAKAWVWRVLASLYKPYSPLGSRLLLPMGSPTSLLSAVLLVAR